MKEINTILNKPITDMGTPKTLTSLIFRIQDYYYPIIKKIAVENGINTTDIQPLYKFSSRLNHSAVIDKITTYMYYQGKMAHRYMITIRFTKNMTVFGFMDSVVHELTHMVCSVPSHEPNPHGDVFKKIRKELGQYKSFSSGEYEHFDDTYKVKLKQLLELEIKSSIPYKILKKHIRYKYGKLADMAKLVGLPPTTLYSFFTGRAPVSVKNAIEISKLLPGYENKILKMFSNNNYNNAYINYWTDGTNNINYPSDDIGTELNKILKDFGGLTKFSKTVSTSYDRLSGVVYYGTKLTDLVAYDLIYNLPDVDYDYLFKLTSDRNLPYQSRNRYFQRPGSL